MVHSDPYGALGLLEQALASFQEARRLESSLGDAAHNAGVVKRWLQLIEQQIEQQRARQAAGKGSPQQTAPGPGVEAILRRDNGVRPSGGARSRPLRAEKDW